MPLTVPRTDDHGAAPATGLKASPTGEPPARVAGLAAAWFVFALAALVGAALLAPWASELCRAR